MMGTGRHEMMTPYRRILNYLTPFWPQFAVGSVCIVLANLGKLAAPFILGYAIDDLTSEFTESKLLRYGALLVGVALVQGLFLFMQQRMFIHISRTFEYQVRVDYYAHLQRLPFEFYQKHRTGDLMARAMNDLTAVRMLVSVGVMYALNTVIVVLCIVPLMLHIDWHLTLVAFVLMPLLGLATQSFSRRIHTRAGDVQEYVGMVANRAQESLASLRMTRAYTQERAETESFKQLNREAVSRNLKLAQLTSLFTPTLQFIVEGASLAALCYGGALVIDRTITLGQFVQFMLYISFLIYPMVELGAVISLFQRARVSISRLDEVMSVEPPAEVSRQLSGVEEITGEVEFRKLTFTYQGASQPVLKEISLHIKPGQTVALMGAVGSGKSTLLNLVPRLLEAEPGQVLIDGRRINEIPLEVLRAAIGYVPQESFLFSESIADNIAFGAEGATLAEIERAAADAELVKDINGFPQRYETLLGERGITLSGGQKQRLALARAFIHRPRLLLLDDSLSSVDAYTEERILRNLRRIMRGCTSLLVSHRVSAVREADLIVIIEDGQIVERGTHAELLALGGFYARLYEKQALEAELVSS